MKHLFKLSFLAPILFMLSFSAHAKTLKIATLAPAGTSWMIEMKAGAKIIKQKTKGRVKLKFYPGGVMGNDQSVHRKIKFKQLHGGAFTPGGLSQVNSIIQSLSLPMVFDNFAEVDYVRTKMEPLIRQQMEKSGFVILGISEGGFARILSKQPMKNLQSIRETKVWIPSGDRLSQVTFDALGISPIPLAISDVFTGLQTGLVDTVAVNATSAIAFQWHTNTAYMTESPISYLIGTLAITKKAFEQLSPADQKTVRQEMQLVFDRLNLLNREDNLAARQALEHQGIKYVIADPGEVKKWKAISAKAIEQMIDAGIISAKVVKQVLGHLQDYRKSQN